MLKRALGFGLVLTGLAGAAHAAPQPVKLAKPTEADWRELFARAKKPYDRYIQEAEERANTP